jgi:hypothetical protein
MVDHTHSIYGLEGTKVRNFLYQTQTKPGKEVFTAKGDGER